MIFGRKKTETRREPNLEIWVKETRDLAQRGRNGGLQQMEILVAMSVAIGIELASLLHVEKLPLRLDELVGIMRDGMRDGARQAAQQLGVLPPHNENPEELNEAEFNELTKQIIDVATHSTTTWDSVAATVKALASQIAILSRRPDTSLDELIKFCQKSVATYAYDIRARLEAGSPS